MPYHEPTWDERQPWILVLSGVWIAKVWPRYSGGWAVLPNLHWTWKHHRVYNVASERQARRMAERWARASMRRLKAEIVELRARPSARLGPPQRQLELSRFSM